MIDRPVHSVNGGAVPAGTVDGFDVSAANVARWGGDSVRYLAVLSQGLSVGVSLDQGQVRDLAVVAAWRSGVIGLRTDALRALTGLGDHAAVGAVLGLSPEQVPSFAVGQVSDRFFWPPWRTDYAYLIARVGGFVGLGGPWLAPAHTVTRVAPGQWTVIADGSTWNVDVDLFGHAITTGDYTRAPSKERLTARLHTRPTSYLLDVVREPT